MSRIDDLKASDAKHILHPSSNVADLAVNGPKIIESAKGIYVNDSNGNQLIDAVAGLWCMNIGYGRPEIGQAMAKASGELSYYHTFTSMSNRPQIELAERLIEMAPDNLSKVFFGSGGSDANDTLLKIVWYYNNIRNRPKKRKIISRWQAYHGTSISTASLTGLPSFHKAFNLPIDNILHTDSPDYFRHAKPGESERDFSKRLAKQLDELITKEGSDTVAAFIAEPIMGAGGVVPPPEGYFDEVQPVLKKHDILMIVDEVVCGFGRLGKMFGSYVYDIKPDMMTTAKGLTSGYFPMSAAFISEEIWTVMREGSATLGNFAHGYTYSGHPIGAAVANANLDIIEKEKLVDNAAEVGAYFHQQLQARFGGHENVGQIRGMGLIAAVQMVNEKEAEGDARFFDKNTKIAAQISQACYEEKLIARPLPSIDSIAFSPPLTVTSSEIDMILDRFENSVDKVLNSL